MKTNKASFFLLVFAALFATACNKNVEKMEKIGGFAQGSYYAISYYSPDPNLRAEKLQPRIDSLLHAFDLCASLWNDSSEICRVNRNEDFYPSPMFCDMFEKAQHISQITDGAFDITVGPLVNLYGFSAEKNAGHTIDKDSLQKILACVGWKKVRVSNGKVEKDHPRLRIDFNAIAQGYCADMVAGFLNGLGIERFLADIGGEIRSRGGKTGGKPWIVGIERPAPDAMSERSILQKMELRDCSLVTSGNYRKYFEENGRRFSHTIDPKTGACAQHNLLSATVLCQDCWEADAIATACMVMGKDSAINFVKRFPHRYELFLIYVEADSTLQTWHTDGFPLIE